MTTAFGAVALTPHVDDLTWSDDMHQFVVVKATKFMPAPLQRQILRHKKEILAGAIAGLQDSMNSTIDDETVMKAFNKLVNDLQSETPFAKICYQFGRLSAFINEHSSPIRGIDLNPALSNFRDFVWSESKSFPLVISREGEGFLRENSLAGYLEYQRQRDNTRKKLILQAVGESDDIGTWHDQKSLPYGLATLCYNDMVIDTVRVWLLAWETAGGSIADSSYFPPSGEKVYR